MNSSYACLVKMPFRLAIFGVNKATFGAFINALYDPERILINEYLTRLRVNPAAHNWIESGTTWTEVKECRFTEGCEQIVKMMDEMGFVITLTY